MSGRIRVLVVDDEKIIREIIEDILACEGDDVEVVGVGTCDEALQQVREQEFDVIFLDVCMDEYDGVELLRRIREFRSDPHIYMITGYKVDDQLRTALAEGAAGVIHKPFKVREILAVLPGASSEPAPLSE